MAWERSLDLNFIFTVVLLVSLLLRAQTSTTSLSDVSMCKTAISSGSVHSDCSFMELDSAPDCTRMITNLTSLTLKGNKITAIRRNDWRCYKFLKHLDLSYNRIAEIPCNVFSDLKDLESLDIYTEYARTKVYPGSFQGLIHLRILTISYTPSTICEFPSVEVFESFKHTLIFLNLHLKCDGLPQKYSEYYNYTSPFNYSSLSNLNQLAIGLPSQSLRDVLFKSVRTLRLTHISVNCGNCKYIERGIFNGMKQLTSLYFQFMPFLSIPKLVGAIGATGIKVLTFDDIGDRVIIESNQQVNRKKEIFCNTDVAKSLEELHLASMSTMSIFLTTFQCLERLRVLNFQYMKVIPTFGSDNNYDYRVPTPPDLVLDQLNERNSEFRVFHSLEHFLPSTIEIVNIDYFFMKFIDESARKEMHIRASVDYCENYINKYSKNKFDYYDDGSVARTDDTSFLRSVWKLHIPIIEKIYNNSFMEIRLFYLPRNLKCLTIREFKPLITGLELLKKRIVVIDAPSLMAVNLLGSVGLNTYLKRAPLGALVGNFPKLSLLDFTRTGLTDVSFSKCVIQSLKIFHLADNLLGKYDSLNSQSFQYMSNLELLNLSNNAITSFNTNIIKNLHQLYELDLSSNSLDAISLVGLISYAEHKRNLKLYLEKNLFVCSCVDEAKIKYIQKKMQQEPEWDEIECVWENKNIKVTVIDITSECDQVHIYYLIGSVTFLLVIVVVILTLARKFWSDLVLKYYECKWFVKATKKRYQSYRSDEELYEDDKFLSYVVYDNSCPDIRNFVQEILIKKIETEWNMKLFIPERDALSGGTKAESIHNDMEQCLCYIIILSQGLLDDEMTDFSLQEVQATRRTGLRSRYCILRFGDAPRRHDIPKDLRLLLFPLRLMPVPILTWDEKKQSPFWKRLETFLLAWDLSQ